MEKMERSTVEIELGDQKFVIKTPLSLGQARVFQPAFFRYGGTLTKTENYDALFDAFMAALSRDYPQFTRAQLLACDCTPQEIIAAADKLGFATGIFSKAQVEAAEAAKKKADEALQSTMDKEKAAAPTGVLSTAN